MPTLTIPKEMHRIVHREVVDVIREVLSDPDSGLELTPTFSRRLKKSLNEKRAKKIVSLSEIFAHYGI